MEKAFETFRIGSVRYLAFPAPGGVMVCDDDGNNYGAYYSVESFRAWVSKGKHTIIGKLRLTHCVDDDAS